VEEERKEMNQKILTTSTETNDILRFNILSREAAQLTSKGAKKDDAMQYLLEEFKRIEKNLENILSSTNTEPTEITATAPPPAQENENTNESQLEYRQPSEDESNIQDPLTIKKKGRPEKPKRWKAMVEQEREKTKAKAKKKAKKAETSSKNLKLIQTQ